MKRIAIPGGVDPIVAETEGSAITPIKPRAGSEQVRR